MSLGAWTRGPRLVLALAAVLVALVGGLLAAAGGGDAGLRLVIRSTARTSVALFLAVFAASALHRVRPGRATRWLLQNRRYLGLAFAVSQLLHLLAILALGRVEPTAFADVPWVTIVVGGGGFVVTALMAATSSDAAVRRLSARRWSRLHRFGLYYLWAVFTVTYLGANPWMAAVLVAALVLRLAA
ncbi:MAG TPA: hypothetical protein VNO26_03030 [Candidatus Limnocylindria bacterium]|nr:hypothetical protein [Candidatus Limnocylindria bacterium]